MPGLVHNDTINLSTLVGTTQNRGLAVGILTDAMVAASTTVQQLKDQILAAKVHNDQENYKFVVTKALDHDAAITDAAVNGVTTVAGLVALTQAGASTDINVLE